MRSHANEELCKWGGPPVTLKWRGQRSLETQPATRVERIFSHSLTSRLFPFGFVYRLLLGFYRVFPISCRVSTGFLRFYGKLMAGISPFFLSASRCPVEFTEFYRVLPSFTEFYRVSEARFDSRPQRNRPKHWTGRERDPFSVLACIFCSFFLYLFIFTEFFFPFPADGSDGADAADVDGWRPGRVDNKDR